MGNELNSNKWTNNRMRKLLAGEYCPRCDRHHVLHDDEHCHMRWEKEYDYEKEELCTILKMEKK